MSKVICISNQKGGVGKTTTTINLGVSLAKMGKKVMLIDLDPQGNMTMALGYPQPDELEITIATLLNEEIKNNKKTSSFIEEKNYILSAHGVDFIPANIDLAGLENILINTMSRESVLKRFLEKHKQNYDVILIDTLPSLNILTVNALNAADKVIIPVQAQYLSVKGVELLLETITTVKMNLNPNLEIAGILVTMLDNRANFQKEVVEIILNSYGKKIKIFDAKIPLSVKVSESQSKGEHMIGQKNNKVAESYENFAKEMLNYGI